MEALQSLTLGWGRARGRGGGWRLPETTELRPLTGKTSMGLDSFAQVLPGSELLQPGLPTGSDNSSVRFYK